MFNQIPILISLWLTKKCPIFRFLTKKTPKNHQKTPKTNKNHDFVSSKRGFFPYPRKKNVISCNRLIRHLCCEPTGNLILVCFQILLASCCSIFLFWGDGNPSSSFGGMGNHDFLGFLMVFWWFLVKKPKNHGY